MGRKNRNVTDRNRDRARKSTHRRKSKRTKEKRPLPYIIDAVEKGVNHVSH